ncbi:MAG TPA: DUF885 domain-containing protein [Candidatus Polarisedimenticolia bacterium]|nr:DUF885 domain-containing protein [Candidatus Polarisedimenticolia bacterium]
MSRLINTRQALIWSCMLSFGALAMIHALTTAAAEPNPIDKKFYEIAERYLDETQKLFPTTASINGYHKYDSLLEDFSVPGVAKMTATLKGFQKQLSGIDRAKLSVSAQVDRDLLWQDCESSLFLLTTLRPFQDDPLFYNDILGNSTLFITQTAPEAPEFRARMESLVGRMKKIPGFLEQARKNLQKPSEVQTSFCILMNPGNVEFFESSLPPLAEKVPALKGAVETERAKVLAALKVHQKWLETDLLPRSKGDWKLGKDLWTKKLRYNLGSDLTPEEILRRAEEKLKKDREEMLKVARPLHDEYFPDHKHEETGDDLINVVVKETFSKLRDHHSKPETLFSDVKDKWTPKIKGFIRKSGIIDLPPEDDNFVIEPTPAFMDGAAVAFFNPPPAFEPSLKKSFWVSSIPKGGSPEKDAEVAESYLREYNDYGLQSLIIHEAFPGHYVQSWYALKSPLATIYKKVYASGTFAEGWAVMAEEEMFTNGFAEGDPANYLVHKKFDLRVPMNAILDSKLHTSDLSEAEGDKWAMDLMTRLGFQEEAEARGKLRRAKITATQLSTYFVGFTELWDMLLDAKAKEGPKFNLKAFNERLLSFGTIPPRDVRRLMFAAPATPDSAKESGK